MAAISFNQSLSRAVQVQTNFWYTTNVQDQPFIITKNELELRSIVEATIRPVETRRIYSGRDKKPGRLLRSLQLDTRGCDYCH